VVKVTFGGHACFLLKNNEHQIIIDPFLTGNPLAGLKAEKIDVQYILVTHGHGDHVGDTIVIAQRTGATVIAPFELAMYCQGKGVDVHPMHIGGSREFSFGKVKLTPAFHGSAIQGEHGMEYTGNPCGFLLEIDRKTIYHAGDTGLFGDMKLIGEYTPVDLALLPIGDNFGMGPDDAVEAAKFVKAKQVVPMHYNTFDLIKQDPQDFKRKLHGIAECMVLEPGQSLEL
jgi:L-ascorbate metabolism protein UlaG (beta-lactamase superfamily)